MLQAEGGTTGEAAPDFTLTDSNGNAHTLSDFKGKHVVLEWTNYECPFVKKHYGSGNMQALQKKYTDQGVVWLTLCSSAKGKQGHYSPEDWNQKLTEAKSSPTAFLIDADGTVGRKYGAKVTPHMFVVNAEGTLIYQGAIDSIKSWKPEDIPQAENFVESALNASMKGEAVATSDTKPYGCGVKY
jgi:peroxiredoxin